MFQVDFLNKAVMHFRTYRKTSIQTLHAILCGYTHFSISKLHFQNEIHII